MTPRLASHQQLDAGIAARRHAGYKALKQARHPFTSYFRDAFPCSPSYSRSIVGKKGVISAYHAVQMMHDPRRHWAAPWQRGSAVGGTRIRGKRQDVLERVEPHFGEDAIDGVIARMLTIAREWDREDDLQTPMLLLSAGLSARVTAHSAACAQESPPHTLSSSTRYTVATTAPSAHVSRCDDTGATHLMPPSRHAMDACGYRERAHAHDKDTCAEQDYVMVDGVRVMMRPPRRFALSRSHSTSQHCDRIVVNHGCHTLSRDPAAPPTLPGCTTGVHALPTLVLDALRGPLLSRTQAPVCNRNNINNNNNSNASNSENNTSPLSDPRLSLPSVAECDEVLCLRWKAPYRRSVTVAEMLQLHRHALHATAALGIPPRSAFLLLRAMAAAEVEQPAMAVALTVAVGEHYYAYSVVQSLELLRCVRRLALVHARPQVSAGETSPESNGETATPGLSNSCAVRTPKAALKSNLVERGRASMMCSTPLYNDAALTASMLSDFVHDAAPFLVQKVWSRLPESARYLAHHGCLLDWLDGLSLAVEMAGTGAMPSHLPNPSSHAPDAAKYLFLRHVLHMDDSLVAALRAQLHRSDEGMSCSEPAAAAAAAARQRDAHARVVWLCASLLVRLVAESVGDVLRHASHVLHSCVHALMQEAEQRLAEMGSDGVSNERRTRARLSRGEPAAAETHSLRQARHMSDAHSRKEKEENDKNDRPAESSRACDACAHDGDALATEEEAADMHLCGESEATDIHKRLDALSLSPVMHLAGSYQLIGRRRPKRMRVRLVPFEAFPHIARCQPPPFLPITQRVHARRWRERRRAYARQRARLRAPLVALLAESPPRLTQVERVQAALQWGTMVLRHATELVQSLRVSTASHDEGQAKGDCASIHRGARDELSVMMGTWQSEHGAAAAEALSWRHVCSRVEWNMDAVFRFIVWDDVDEQLQPLLQSAGEAVGACAPGAIRESCGTAETRAMDEQRNDDGYGGGDEPCAVTEAERRARRCVSQLHDDVLAFEVAVADILDEHELYFSST